MHRQLDDKTLVAGQIAPEDVPALKALGVTLIVNNRPDFEDANQPESDDIEAAARAAAPASLLPDTRMRECLHWILLPPCIFTRALPFQDGNDYCTHGGIKPATWSAISNGCRSRAAPRNWSGPT